MSPTACTRLKGDDWDYRLANLELLQWRSGGRQFVNNLTKITISNETKQLIDRLLLERISLRGIARAIQVSWSWLQDYVNQKLDLVPQWIKVSGKAKGRLTIECDEMWSFVVSKKNEVYI